MKSNQIYRSTFKNFDHIAAPIWKQTSFVSHIFCLSSHAIFKF